MLCDRCTYILQSLPELQEEEIPHHADSQSFKAALMAGCFTCMALASEIDGVVDILDDSATTSYTYWDLLESGFPRFGMVWVADQNGKELSGVREIFLMPSNEINQSLASDVIDAGNRPDSAILHPTPRGLYDLPKKWLRECTDHHEKCKSINEWKTPGVRYQPKRLVDVGDGNEKMWKLVLRDEAGGHQYEYATLSHRWTSPSDQQFRLLEANLQDFQRGQPVANLPQGFQDAISAARNLDIRYIWIDCLCIIQDSEADWKTESLEMRRVYSDSILNLCATGVADNSHGFLNSLQKLITLPEVQPLWACDHNGPWRVVDPFFWWAEVTKTALLKRGWVFQERFLAPRVLHFGAQQMLWECATLDACETFPNGLINLTLSVGHTGFKRLDAFLSTMRQNRFDSSSAAGLQEPRIEEINTENVKTESTQLHDELLQHWCDTVESYTRTSLTKPEDKLIAFAGVAEMMSGLYKTLGQESSDYLAGIFAYHLLLMLEWHAHSPWNVKHQFKTSGSRPTGYRAPSWSWASIDGRIFYEFLPGITGRHERSSVYRKELSWIRYTEDLDYPQKHIGWKPLVSDLTAQAQPAAGSPFGQILGGSLRMRGRVVSIATIMDSRLSALLYEDPPLGTSEDICSAYGLPLRCIDLITSEGERSWWITGLMIRPVDEHRGTYQRCGLFFIPSSEGIQALDIETSADRGKVKYSDGIILDSIEII